MTVGYDDRTDPFRLVVDSNLVTPDDMIRSKKLLEQSNKFGLVDLEGHSGFIYI